ncbi:MAG: adenylate/guanylate cyclase domain-containing protein, partial [Ignavibacteriae bacterium]|nr:adenylate/guanylate cyclase domain-containing protein [Ignavibacteriota bacterium]
NINTSFKKFVPNEFIRIIEKQDVSELKLGDFTHKEMCILFSDIRSFTSMSEKMTPKECFEFLNDYLGKMGPIIRKNGGFIDKFIGDAIMALFENSVDKALVTAIEMQTTISKINIQRQSLGLTPIKAGIGIHKGDMILGIIGENERFEGTVIADSVNTGSRIEELTKVYNSNILIS